LALAGILLLVIGFTIMANDHETYGFGFMGITLGPVIVMCGFVVEIAAILYKPKAKK